MNNSKTTELKEMLDRKEIDQTLHDEALNLTQKYFPWVWKRNNNKIIGIIDAFKDIREERESKTSKRKKSC